MAASLGIKFSSSRGEGRDRSVRDETVIMISGDMDHKHFETMPIDELWALHTQVAEVLAVRLIAEKQKLEKRLAQLGRADRDEPAKHEAKISQSNSERRSNPGSRSVQ
jgi:hypothetical protein